MTKCDAIGAQPAAVRATGAAQPLPSYDSVRSVPATTYRRVPQTLCAGPLPIEICRHTLGAYTEPIHGFATLQPSDYNIGAIPSRRRQSPLRSTVLTLRDVDMASFRFAAVVSAAIRRS
jgi:hypothetical protein